MGEDVFVEFVEGWILILGEVLEALGGLVWGELPVFVSGDGGFQFCGEFAGGVAVETALFNDLFDDAFGVIVVEDGEIACEPELGGVGTQDLCSETVECAYCGRGGWDLDELAEAFAHFTGGFAGECYGEDRFGRDVLVCY